MIGAMTALPATLRLLGPNVNRWQLGRRTVQSVAARFSKRATERPVLAAVLVLTLMVALAAPASGVKLGIPSVENLPRENQVRKDFDRIRDTVGPGWWLPFEILLTSDKGPLTESRKLTKIDRFQDRIADDPNVEAVLGPGLLAKEELEGTVDGLISDKRSSMMSLRRPTQGRVNSQRGSPRQPQGLVSSTAERRTYHKPPGS